MWTYIARRFLAIPPLLLAVSFLTHCLLYAAPGDYFSRLLENPQVTEEVVQAMRVNYGLDGGLFYRYWHWLANAFTGEFGYSYRFDVPVFSLISERLINTLILSLSALVLAWGLALPLGVYAAVHQGKLMDRIVGFVSFVGLSIPRVFFALLMVMFAASSGWFPTGGMRDQIYWDEFTAWQKFVDVSHHLVLPAIVIGTTSMARYMRQMRAEMVETLSKDFVRTAKAKGLGHWQVVYKHAFGNAVNPLITLFGYSLAGLLTGSFLVEIVFAWPGMARLTVDAVFAQDEPLVMASVIMATCMLVLGNLIADLMLAFVDPRIGLD